MTANVSFPLLVMALSLLSGTAVAEEVPPVPRHWTVQVDPLTTALGFVHVQVEHTLGDHASVYLGPHLRLFSAPFSDPEDFVGYGVELGVRWYFLGGAPRGWWGLVRGVGASLHTDANGNSESALGGYGSLLGGYTFIIAGWLVLSLGGGLQYLHYTVDGLGPKTFAPAAHTAIGVAF